MSWSLQIRHGDLVLGGAKLSIVTNEAKLVQDLRCHILERMGTDDMHPEYGSLLDGGVSPDGMIHEGVIGETRQDLIQLTIESEIHRIVQEYQDKQLTRAKSDRQIYGKVTLTRGEVLYNLNSIDFDWGLDGVRVLINISIGSGIDTTIPVTITNNGLLQ